MIVSGSGPTKKYTMPRGRATAANVRQMIASPRRAGRGEGRSTGVGTPDVGAGIPSRIVPRAHARKPRFPVVRLTGLRVGRTPFCDVHADSSSRAIMPRVADALRMIVLGFNPDDAKLF